MDQPITIKVATADDVGILANVIRQSFRDVATRFSLTPENCPKHPSNCTAVWIESDLSRGVQYFILSQCDEPLGCVGLERPNPHFCYLERLAVLPGHREQGFGRLLVAHALSQAKEDGATWVSIGIIDGHTELKAWYVKLGFVEIETKSFSHLPFRVSFMRLNINDTANKGAARDSDKRRH
jgi:GNAT superfamily N-acetyltransferase